VGTEGFRLNVGLKLLERKPEGILRRGDEMRAGKALEVARGVEAVGKELCCEFRDIKAPHLEVWKFLHEAMIDQYGVVFKLVIWVCVL